MNTTPLWVSALALAAVAAAAQEGTQVPIEPSTLTRAEVKAELARARAAGDIVNGQDADWRASRAVARKATTAPPAEAEGSARAPAHAAVRAAFDPTYVGG